MPELPELEVTRERLAQALTGLRIKTATLHHAFVLRSVDPPFDSLVGNAFRAFDRRGKHLLFRTDPDTVMAVHLMLGGRLRLRPAEKFKPHRKRTLLSLAFEDGSLLEMTEAGTQRRASVLLFRGALPEHIDRGCEPLDDDFTEARFAELLARGNHQIKTALRDPSLLSGIGNAYSDEILHAARLSPVKLTSRLTDEEIARLYHALRDSLLDWIERIRQACPPGLPASQDLWRRDMAVHGRPGQPCPACGDTIQRISFSGSETHYCPTCQNEGRLLADRRMSRFGIRRRERAPE
ncbi:MAG: formamidopyrimidine-DNA glycosylase [Gemmatimonadota bacterium]|nr:MAG: formamidopyrimidine-DNA glycosylase [Gemmatimonadota bacterium]